MSLFVEGKLFREAGTGTGGDKHNKGYFVDETALTTAYPIGEAGDYAIVESTDTVWVWDSDTSAWKDSDQKGQVTSVNNQTGDVTLTASDVGALPANTHIPADPVQADWGEADSAALDYIKNKPTLGTAAAAATTDFATAAQGAKADTAVQPADLATVATSGSYNDLSNKPTIPDAVQYSTMPTASADNLGDIVQFTGTTDANYTNGYFYQCVSDGQEPATYSWTRVDVQPAGGVTSVNGKTGAVQLNALDVDGVLQISQEADKDTLPLNTIFQYVGNEVGATLQRGWFYRVITVHEVGLEQSKVGSFTYTIDEETYMTYANPQPRDNYRFKYNTGTSSWSLSINSGAETPVNLADYGITVEGTLNNSCMLWVRYYTQRETVVSNIAVQGGLKAVVSMNIASQRWSNHQTTSTVNTFTTGDVVFVEPNATSADEWVRCGVRLTNDYTDGKLHFVCDITPTTSLSCYYVVVASSNTNSGIVMNTTKSQYIQYSTMPTAGVDYVGKIVQYIGTTDANYTNGYFYKGATDGDPNTPTYSWERVDVQPAGSVGGLKNITDINGALADGSLDINEPFMCLEKNYTYNQYAGIDIENAGNTYMVTEYDDSTFDQLSFSSNENLQLDIDWDMFKEFFFVDGYAGIDAIYNGGSGYWEVVVDTLDGESISFGGVTTGGLASGYGITVTGTPEDNDEVLASFSPATITMKDLSQSAALSSSVYISTQDWVSADGGYRYDADIDGVTPNAFVLVYVKNPEVFYNNHCEVSILGSGKLRITSLLGTPTLDLKLAIFPNATIDENYGYKVFVAAEPFRELPNSSGLSDGTYALKLVVTNGVPSLSWEAQ